MIRCRFRPYRAYAIITPMQAVRRTPNRRRRIMEDAPL